MRTIAEERADRAMQIAKLAVIMVVDGTPGSNDDVVNAAEDILVAAENLVAKKYGEFR